MPRMTDSPTRFAFTAKNLDALGSLDADSPSAQKEYCDSLSVGLRLMVGKGNPPRKSWLFRFRFRGRKRSISLGEYPAINLKAARDRVLDLKAQLAKGEDPSEERERRNSIPGFTTFAREHYLPHAMNTKRSWKDDVSRLDTGGIPYFKERQLDTISTRDVQQFHATMKEKKSASTANRHLCLLQRMFTLAIQWNFIPAGLNPCRCAKKFQESPSVERYLSLDEVKRFLEALEVTENKVIASALRMLLFTGLRKREVLDLKWEDVDRERGTIVLRFTKSGRVRTVPLSSGAMREIDLMWERRVGKHPYVWPGREANAPISNPQKSFVAALERANIERCRVHDLRHTYASTLVNSGATLFEVQKALGHSSSNMTQRYSHLSDSTLRDRAEMASQLMTGTHA